MLPLSLLKAAQNYPMLIELKNGETYNGHLVCCDSWMNISLKEVICTSKDGDRFWRIPECYIRGSNIKDLRMPDEIIENVKEDFSAKPIISSGMKRGVSGQRARAGGDNRGPSQNQSNNNQSFQEKKVKKKKNK